MGPPLQCKRLSAATCMTLQKKKVTTAELEKAIFSQPSLGISNWADEDDDDYAMPSLPIDWDEVRCRRL